MSTVVNPPPAKLISKFTDPTVPPFCVSIAVGPVYVILPLSAVPLIVAAVTAPVPAFTVVTNIVASCAGVVPPKLLPATNILSPALYPDPACEIASTAYAVPVLEIVNSPLVPAGAVSVPVTPVYVSVFLVIVLVNAPLILIVVPATVLTKIASPLPLSAAWPATIPVVLETWMSVFPIEISCVKFSANAVPPGVLEIAVTCVPVGNAALTIGAPTSGISPVNANLFSLI